MGCGGDFTVFMVINEKTDKHRRRVSLHFYDQRPNSNSSREQLINLKY